MQTKIEHMQDDQKKMLAKETMLFFTKMMQSEEIAKKVREKAHGKI